MPSRRATIERSYTAGPAPDSAQSSHTKSFPRIRTLPDHASPCTSVRGSASTISSSGAGSSSKPDSGSGSAAAFAEPRASVEERFTLAPEHIAEPLVLDAGGAHEQLVHERQLCERGDVLWRGGLATDVLHQEPVRSGRHERRGADREQRRRLAEQERLAGDPFGRAGLGHQSVPSQDARRTEPREVLRRRAQAHQDVGGQLGHRDRVRRAATGRGRARSGRGSRARPGPELGRGHRPSRTRAGRRSRRRSR